MSVTVPIKTIELTPGSHITIPNLSWQDFEQILIDLGEKRSSRVTYFQGTLEIMSPLALHERPHRIIAYILTTILDIQRRNWEDFRSTTLKRPQIAGIEPDTCFYIQNADRMKGCTNLDLKQYPPPDLAIEADVTSKTTLNAYEAMGVPELWIYRNQQLKIYLLSDRGYTESSISPTFPNLPIIEIIPQQVQKAIDEGTSKMLRELRTDTRIV
ncbi:Uma2 family endonuclease [Phormidium sp. LEGE 05292]|uniref:Uma2 family endonuclease n=1 Tax=[Phormidium] sp. LEGE 05292 TaxID=767427 RepID=UPI00187E5875|nr:Uma2 family endonuclease [Phormidium sp. LEGE 05292]MBE9229442.1 Uma2 family endonuclease [Phormidium sp. LEGE 05292]